MYCKYCGTENTDDSEFCKKCGKKIKDKAPVIKKQKKSNKLAIILGVVIPVVIIIIVLAVLALMGYLPFLRLSNNLPDDTNERQEIVEEIEWEESETDDGDELIQDERFSDPVEMVEEQYYPECEVSFNDENTFNQ